MQKKKNASASKAANRSDMQRTLKVYDKDFEKLVGSDPAVNLTEEEIKGKKRKRKAEEDVVKQAAKTARRLTGKCVVY